VYFLNTILNTVLSLKENKLSAFSIIFIVVSVYVLINVRMYFINKTKNVIKCTYVFVTVIEVLL